MKIEKDAVKRANPIERVIPELLGEHALEVGDELKVRCPWHEDKRPSLRVNPSKAVWRCDPCNIGGDVYAFVERFNRCDFREALAWLAKAKNIDPKTPVRDYRLHDRLSDLPFLHTMAIAALEAAGLNSLAQRMQGWGSVQAMDRLNLDGLLALWQPPLGN